MSEQEHAMYKVHMQADECAHARCIWDVLCSTRLEMECAIEHTRPSRRCWWKWSRGVNGRWCQQLCSAVLCAAVLCCSAVCSALHWCQQLAAQAKAEHTSHHHSLYPITTTGHLLSINIRQACNAMHIHTCT